VESEITYENDWKASAGGEIWGNTTNRRLTITAATIISSLACGDIGQSMSACDSLDRILAPIARDEFCGSPQDSCTCSLHLNQIRGLFATNKDQVGTLPIDFKSLASKAPLHF
jgi:hypothetical protein